MPVQDAAPTQQTREAGAPQPQNSPWARLENWSGQNQNAQAQIVLARSEVKNGRIIVTPDDPRNLNIPQVTLPNNVGAIGYPKSTHTYYVQTLAPENLKNIEGLRYVSTALRNDPTPGNDFMAMPMGARNNAGGIAPFDGGTNYVHSYWVPSQSNNQSGKVINYTIAGQHVLNEGYVVRVAHLRDDGRIVLTTYGEGNSSLQSDRIDFLWRGKADQLWGNNAQNIFQSATNLQQAERR